MSGADSPAVRARGVRLGAVVWILAAQFFVAQAVVQTAWTTPFSLTQNFVSDLGNTVCGPYPGGQGRFVCSPWHAAMNASFIVQGLIIIAGALLLRSIFPRGAARSASLVLLVLAGIGNIGVGLFPENVDITWHEVGAALHFLLGNAGVMALGFSLRRSRGRDAEALLAVVSGAAGLAATGLFIAGQDLGIGVGGMERVAAYAVPLWLIVFGTSLVRETGTPRARLELPA